MISAIAARSAQIRPGSPSDRQKRFAEYITTEYTLHVVARIVRQSSGKRLDIGAKETGENVDPSACSVKSWTFALGTFLILTSCSNAPKATDTQIKYRIEKAGAPDIKEEFEFKGTTAMGVTQRYDIIASGGDAISFHFLVTKVEKFLGDKFVETEKAIQIPINNGSGYYDCFYRQSIDVGQSYDDLKETMCKLTPVGVIKVDSISATSVSSR